MVACMFYGISTQSTSISVLRIKKIRSIRYVTVPKERRQKNA